MKILVGIALALASLMAACALHQPTEKHVPIAATVYCHDGSWYVDSLNPDEDFRCDWKSLKFHY